MNRRKPLAAVALTWFFAGCGLGLVDNDSGGAEHLPTQGAGPYGKLGIDLDTPIDEPFVVEAFHVQLSDPSPMWRDDGGFRLWFGYKGDVSGTRSEIGYAELPALTELPDVLPAPVLSPDAAWERESISAPCVVDVGDGHLVMFYEGGLENPAIGRADSFDDGQTWIKHSSNPILADSAQPSVSYLGEGDWLLYATRVGRSGIYRADSSDGNTWVYRDDPVLRPRVASPEAFDRYAVWNPFAVVRKTASGQYHYGLFFNAVASDEPEASVAVGWAGSYDGVAFRRFANPDEPVLAPEGASEYGPSVLIRPDRGIMFYNELNQGVQAIAAATHP